MMLLPLPSRKVRSKRFTCRYSVPRLVEAVVAVTLLMVAWTIPLAASLATTGGTRNRNRNAHNNGLTKRCPSLLKTMTATSTVPKPTQTPTSSSSALLLLQRRSLLLPFWEDDVRVGALGIGCCTFTLSLLFGMSPTARAAVPTIDDYVNTATGASIKSSSKGKDDAAIRLQLQILSQKPPAGFPSSTSTMVDLADALLVGLKTLMIVVDAADWATVRTVLRSEGPVYGGNVFGVVRKPYFATNEKILAKALGVSPSKVKPLEDGREDLAYALSELEDFALENRSVFFNSEDRKQMDQLIAETGYQEKIAEGNALLSKAMDTAQAFRKVAMNL